MEPPPSDSEEPPASSNEPTADGLAPTHDPYAALRVRDFQLFLTGNVLSVIGMQMQSVALQWEVYLRTRSPLALGWVGLCQIIPVLLLALPAGQAADRYSRKHILMACMAMLACVSFTLSWLSRAAGPLWAMYLCVVLVGVTRAFQQPSKASLVPLIVPRQKFTNAVSWGTGGFHLAAIVGPALGGFAIAWSGRAWMVYMLDVVLACTFFTMLALMKTPLQARATNSEPGLQSLVVGLRFVYRTKIMLAALTLDMFAVLLGGATALMPIFAEDILQVGPKGLGWMRAMPAVGALLMAFTIAHLPPMQKAGRTLIWSVVGFGIATIVFGISRSYGLSLAALFLIGALDNISVVIRHTLVQMLTPDEMRGRVSAVNSMFIGASNELGGFESGLVAQYTSPTFSVVSGGIGTLIVVATVAMRFPQLVRYGRLAGPVGEQPLEATAKSAPVTTPNGQASAEPTSPLITRPAASPRVSTDSASE